MQGRASPTSCCGGGRRKNQLRHGQASKMSCCASLGSESEDVMKISKTLPMLLSNESRRSTLMMICCGLIIQKVVLGINLILMKEPRREQYKELIEVYPLT